MPARAADDVNLELMPAVDASRSIDIAEYVLRLRGIDAFGDAEAFAILVDSLKRRQFGGARIGKGPSFAVDTSTGNGIIGTRRVVDASGDGRETLADGVVLQPETRR